MKVRGNNEVLRACPCLISGRGTGLPHLELQGVSLVSCFSLIILCFEAEGLLSAWTHFAILQKVIFSGKVFSMSL